MTAPLPGGLAVRECSPGVLIAHERIPARFGLDWVKDVQVLAPMYRGECGVDSLNERLRAVRDGGDHELVYAGRTWRVGDRVIQTRNDYDREVFNGDMGLVEGLHEGGLTVAFPEQKVGYALEHLSDLQLAFAVTVHRAQGSEWFGRPGHRVSFHSCSDRGLLNLGDAQCSSNIKTDEDSSRSMRIDQSPIKQWLNP